MHSFEELSIQFKELFSSRHFPETPSSLYDPAEYFLGLGGKRIRPTTCLMANELFDDILPDAWHVSTAIELFHNFTLIHDDIMDKAPLRRGMQTIHERYGNPTALLAGDVMLIVAYDYLNKIQSGFLHRILRIFNTTAKQVCEGQQLDMDFEQRETVAMDDYIKMITLKTSVLIAASLKMGAVLGGAGEGNQDHLYEFGKNLGIAFQIQDDWLDAFGDPVKFGKKRGGDIESNKKTFLMIHALESGNKPAVAELKKIMKEESPGKVEKILNIYRDCKVDKWANDLKEKYIDAAFSNLEDVAVLSKRKEPLHELAQFLVQREH